MHKFDKMRFFNYDNQMSAMIEASVATPPAQDIQLTDIIQRIQPPWMPLYRFLSACNLAHARHFAQYGYDTHTVPWQPHRAVDFNCANYAFNSAARSFLQIDNLPHCAYWHEGTRPLFFNQIAAEYAQLGETIATERRQHNTDQDQSLHETDIGPAIAGHMLLLLQHGLQIVEKPEHVKPGHYVISYGMMNHGYGFHFARLNRDGIWADKPGCQPVRQTGHSDPFKNPGDFVPLCFFAVPA